MLLMAGMDEGLYSRSLMHTISQTATAGEIMEDCMLTSLTSLMEN